MLIPSLASGKHTCNACGAKTHKLHGVVAEDLGKYKAVVESHLQRETKANERLLICCKHFEDDHPARMTSSRAPSHYRQGMDGNQSLLPSTRSLGEWQQQRPETAPSPSRVLSPKPPPPRRRSVRVEEYYKPSITTIPGLGKYDSQCDNKESFLAEAVRLINELARDSEAGEQLVQDLAKQQISISLGLAFGTFAKSMSQIPPPFERALAAIKAFPLLHLERPSVRALSKHLDCSTSTIYRAIEASEDDNTQVRSNFARNSFLVLFYL